MHKAKTKIFAKNPAAIVSKIRVLGQKNQPVYRVNTAIIYIYMLSEKEKKE